MAGAAVLLRPFVSAAPAGILPSPSCRSDARVGSRGGWRGCRLASPAPARGPGEATPLRVQNPAQRLSLPLLSRTASLPPRRRFHDGRRRQGLNCRAASLDFDVVPAAVTVLAGVLTFAALRTYIYFRMEYIIAAMLGRHVSKGGAKVVELNIRGGRSLYYYPADVEQVVAVSSNSNVQLLKNQGGRFYLYSSRNAVRAAGRRAVNAPTYGELWESAVRAGVPIDVKTGGPTAVGVPSATIDAVVSVFCLCNIADTETRRVLREAVRVLKPGKSFIFIESVGVGNKLTRTAKSVFESLSSLVGFKSAVRRNLLPLIQEVKEFEELEYEEVFSFVDPHVVGVAKKKLPVFNESRKEARKKSKA